MYQACPELIKSHRDPRAFGLLKNCINFLLSFFYVLTRYQRLRDIRLFKKNGSHNEIVNHNEQEIAIQEKASFSLGKV
jgi:hypothetical protein